jgi:Protein of unknown function (DUF3455)
VTAGEATFIVRAMRILLIALLLALVGASSASAHVKPPTVPSGLQPPVGNQVVKVGHAVGVQIYTCNGTAWTLTGPRANLYNEHGKLRWIHFAGPTWQHNDGSKVVGQLFAPAVTVSPTAIPWLLLRGASTEAGPFGDQMVGTTFIQRVNTTGGLAPTAPCTPSNPGTVVEVPYTADYYFWKAVRGVARGALFA